MSTAFTGKDVQQLPFLLVCRPVGAFVTSGGRKQEYKKKDAGYLPVNVRILE